MPLKKTPLVLLCHASHEQPKWHWLCGLVPLVIVILMLNILPNILRKYDVAELSSSQAIVVALLGGIMPNECTSV